jgi:hypothetical protein
MCGKEPVGPCWEDQKNVHLCLANWKSNKTGVVGRHISAAAMKGADHGEILLSGLWILCERLDCITYAHKHFHDCQSGTQRHEEQQR